MARTVERTATAATIGHGTDKKNMAAEAAIATGAKKLRRPIRLLIASTTESGVVSPKTSVATLSGVGSACGARTGGGSSISGSIRSVGRRTLPFWGASSRVR
jgi:hypothetical protein